MVTSHDVARLAGVSQPTVSRALRDSTKVSEDTRRRVREAATALGYVPSETGRALSSGRTRRIGLLLTDLENQFYPHVIAPIHRELESLDYQLVLQTESSDTGRVAERLLANALDGVLLATTTVDSVLPVRLRDRGVPFVYFNRTSLSVEADSAEVDAESGMRELARRILELGHRRVGAIFGPRNTSTAEHRESVLREVLGSASVTIGADLSHRGPFDVDTGYTGARRLLELDEPPTVIVCGNDVVAFGALNAAHEVGSCGPGRRVRRRVRRPAGRTVAPSRPDDRGVRPRRHGAPCCRPARGTDRGSGRPVPARAVRQPSRRAPNPRARAPDRPAAVAPARSTVAVHTHTIVTHPPSERRTDAAGPDRVPAVRRPGRLHPRGHRPDLGEPVDRAHPGELRAGLDRARRLRDIGRRRRGRRRQPDADLRHPGPHRSGRGRGLGGARDRRIPELAPGVVGGSERRPRQSDHRQLSLPTRPDGGGVGGARLARGGPATGPGSRRGRPSGRASSGTPAA